jgi:poly(ADP-ribose) glycohydrolase
VLVVTFIHAMHVCTFMRVLCVVVHRSMLFFPKMGPRDAIIITGAKKYAVGYGYCDSFTFVSKLDDSDELQAAVTIGTEAFRNKRKVPDVPAVTESVRVWNSTVVAIDALYFSSVGSDTEFSKVNIEREFLKAYAGFNILGGQVAHTAYRVSTGHWGCGAFNGDRQLKAVIQWLAVSFSDKKEELTYCAFDDVVTFKPAFDAFTLDVKRASYTPKQVYDALVKTATDGKLKSGNAFVAVIRTLRD